MSTPTRIQSIAPIRWPGIALASTFFVVRLAALRDYGETWDERESYNTGAAYLNIIVNLFWHGKLPDEWPWHHIPGTSFVVDATVVGAGRVLGWLGGVSDQVGVHAFRLMMVAVSIYLFFRLVQAVAQRTDLAVLSAALFAVNLDLIAHSQNNPKDLPCAFLFIWALKVAVTALQEPVGKRNLVGLSAIFALGITSRPFFVIFLPTLAAWWLFGFERKTRPRILLRELLVLASASAGFSLLFWPWALQHATEVVPALRVGLDTQSTLSVSSLFLGDVRDSDKQPWFYVSVLFLATTPIVMLWTAVISLSVLRPSPRPQPLRVPIILALCWLLPALVMEALSGVHYDTTRHLLFALPAFSILVAVGVLRICDILTLARFGASTTRRLRFALCAALPIYGLVLAWRMHPYQGAYLNELARAYVGSRDAADVFEVEYWGSSFREGSNWLNAHAEPDAVVHVPFAGHCAAPFLRRELTSDVATFADTARPRYFMLMNRRGFKEAADLAIEAAYPAVFMITRQNGTLLKIFKNTSKR